MYLSSVLSVCLYFQCLAAATHIESVAIHINEDIRRQENFHKMLSIQNSLTGLISVPSIISPARRFIKEGRIMKVYNLIYLLNKLSDLYLSGVPS